MSSLALALCTKGAFAPYAYVMTQMQSYQARTRLYVDVFPLAASQAITVVGSQAHYLRSVLRAQVGNAIEVFNGSDGAFFAEITALGKSAAQLMLGKRVAPQETLPKLALAFAIVKKERVQMIVEKATELGAARIIPIIAERTQGQAVKQLKMEKLKSYGIEAAEQCGRTALAQLSEPTQLRTLLDDTSAPNQILYADEIRAGDALQWPQPVGWTTILIGPEGGLSPTERSLLVGNACAYPIALGPRILRAETAAISALCLWQGRFGDWLR